jgi:AraC family transcriptional regulator of adaptative response / DNA-3-methyladenine glycosylase II
LLGKLTRQFGVSLAGAASRGHPSITHAFPEARDLVDADIAAVGMPRARANAIRGLARTVVVRPAVLSPRRNLDEAIEALKELPGIGEWTAQYIAMRELREPDAFPAGDVGLLRAMEAGPGVRPTPRELLTLAEKWRPWRAYAAAHLWASLSTPGLRPWQPRAKHSAA